MQARRQRRRENERAHEFFNRALTMLCGPRESRAPATSLMRLKQRGCRAERGYWGGERGVRPFFRITTLRIRNDRRPEGEWLARRKTPRRLTFFFDLVRHHFWKYRHEGNFPTIKRGLFLHTARASSRRALDSTRIPKSINPSASYRTSSAHH